MCGCASHGHGGREDFATMEAASVVSLLSVLSIAP